MKNILKIILHMPIRFYKYFISPLTGQNCRFHPTCSSYAQEAIEKLPVHIALIKIIWRLLRCQPFSKGGHDPVEK
jgi:putative membrane protein insertion efficiency factor